MKTRLLLRRSHTEAVPTSLGPSSGRRLFVAGGALKRSISLVSYSSLDVDDVGIVFRSEPVRRRRSVVGGADWAPPPRSSSCRGRPRSAEAPPASVEAVVAAAWAADTIKRRWLLATARKKAKGPGSPPAPEARPAGYQVCFARLFETSYGRYTPHISKQLKNTNNEIRVPFW